MSPYDSEIDLLETLVEEHPGSRLVLRLVKVYRDAGRLAEAAAVLERALAANPAKLENRAALAEVLEELGNSDGALAQLVAVARELAGYSGVFGQMARLLAARGKQADAERAQGIATALKEPFAVGTRRGLAVDTATTAEIYANQGMLEKARGIYRRLVAESPEDPALAYRLAELERGLAAPGPMGAVLAQLSGLRLAALSRVRGN